MKRFLYIFGMAMTLCCCSSKEDKSPAAEATKSDSGVNHLYAYYDLRNEDPGCEVSGFSGCESFGRWSDGDTAIVDLMAAPMAEITAKLCIDRVICPDSEPFEFDVEVNGDRLSHYAVNGHSTVYVNVPKENLGADGSARLVFIFKNAAKPGKYNPENHDGRKLGFAVTNITVYGYSQKK
ncbi:MAG: hypothetical protein KBT22_10025 [Bacteroidales bacterium]|nr:hypothetical protein [Candidatus Scybalocola fimicaballi]